MKNYVLKYNKPAEYSENGWQNEVLPIGNGMLGMCVFGGVSEEHLQFNEKTLWTGGPSKSRKDYIGGNVENSYEYLEKSEMHCAAVIKRQSLNLRISL